jgi:hypothetical protein
VIAELYCPAAALTAGILLLVLLWRTGYGDGCLFAAGVLGGLSLGVHNTVTLLAPAILVYLALTALTKRSWTLAVAGALVGVALALGAFLLLDALDSPSSYYNSVARPSLSTWGMTAADFDSPFERLRFLFAARQFRPFMFSEPIRYLPEQVLQYVASLQGIYTTAGLVLTGLGLAAFLAWQWREGVLIWGTLLTMLGFVFNYHVYDIEVFYLPSLIVVMAAAGSGIGALMQGIDRLAGRIGSLPDRWVPHWAHLTAGLLLVAAIIQIGPLLWEGWTMSRLPITEVTDPDYPYPILQPEQPLNLARLVVDHLEDNAIVFTDWDMLYAYYYVAHVEQGRTDIQFHETYPQEGVETVAISALAMIDANLASRPIYFTDPPGELRSAYDFRRVSSGLPLYRVTKIE